MKTAARPFRTLALAESDSWSAGPIASEWTPGETLLRKKTTSPDVAVRSAGSKWPGGPASCTWTAPAGASVAGAVVDTGPGVEDDGAGAEVVVWAELANGGEAWLVDTVGVAEHPIVRAAITIAVVVVFGIDHR